MAFEVSSLLVERPSGVAVYGRELLRALAGRPGGAPCQVYRWSRVHRRRFLPLPGGPARAYGREGVSLHHRFGLVHALDTRVPGRYRGVLVATLFDVISSLPLAAERQLSSRSFQERKLEEYRTIARRADLVITLSAETRDRFIALADPRASVAVIAPGVAPEFFAATPPGADLLSRTGLQGRYLLWVGLLCPRKNLEGALRAYLRARACAPDLQMAVVGDAGDGWRTPAVERAMAESGEGIRLLGYLPRHDLASLYAGASALLYLSHYEGFGLPVLEAMAAGAPVVASRRGGIPEAAGEAGLLVDPDRQEETDFALRRVLQDGGFAADLKRRGRERAAGRTWEAAARAVEAAHEEARASHASWCGRDE